MSTKRGINMEQSKRGRGRPKKGEILEVKNKNKGVIGRPKGTTAIINEYRDRMLLSPKSAKVLESIFDAALDPEHKNQAAAWKLVVDRIAPISAFEPTKGGSSIPQISINISGLTSPTVSTEDVTYDVEDVEARMDVEVKDIDG